VPCQQQAGASPPPKGTRDKGSWGALGRSRGAVRGSAELALGSQLHQLRNPRRQAQSQDLTFLAKRPHRPLQKSPTAISGSLRALLGCSHPKDAARAATPGAFGTRHKLARHVFLCKQGLGPSSHCSHPSVRSLSEASRFAKAPPQGLQGEKGAPRHGSPCAPPWTSPGPSKAMSGRCCRGNTFTTALSIPRLAPCCQALGQRRGRRSAAAERRWRRDLESHRSRRSQQRAPGSTAGTTRRCPRTPLQPRSSSQSTPRSLRTPLLTDARPQARCSHVPQRTPRAIGANLGAAPALAQAHVRRLAPGRAPLPSPPFQRESCRLAGRVLSPGSCARIHLQTPGAGPGTGPWLPRGAP